jgi:hypothetical protein
MQEVNVRYIVNIFVNVTLYPQYYNNIVKSEKDLKKIKLLHCYFAICILTFSWSIVFSKSCE